MTAIFGLCAIGIGVASVGGMQNLPAVVLAVIVGTLLGFVLRLGTSIQKLSQKMLQSLRRFFTDGNRTSNDASQRISCGRYDSGHAACNADELSLEQFDVGDIQNIPLRSDSMPFHAASFFLKCVSIPAEKCLAQPE